MKRVLVLQELFVLINAELLLVKTCLLQFVLYSLMVIKLFSNSGAVAVGNILKLLEIASVFAETFHV